MDGDTDHAVAVTHFINPHLFWYRKIGTPGDDYIRVLADLERKLQDLYRNKPLLETRCRPKVGDKVAVNFVAWNKFIRAEVLQTAEFKQEEFIVWTTDYGFPLMTKKEHVRMLPDTLQFPMSQVHCGGLSNIQPAEIEYDHVESNLIMVKQDEWLQKACDMLEKLLADAASIIFLEEFNSNDDHRWGDLIIINHKGHQFNASTYLKTAKYAMDVGQDFAQGCHKLKTVKIAPWLTNTRKSNMKYNSIKSNMLEHSVSMNTAKIDEFAKRKVEDWCARNERQQDGISTDMFTESGAENNHYQSFDDITFDDSVSVIHNKQMAMEQKSKSTRRHHQGIGAEAIDNFDTEEQMNYIGKAGALTKLKQQKYASKQNVPPPALLQAFEIVPNTTFTAAASPVASPPDQQASTVVSSSNSSSSSVSARMQKLAELRARQARNNMLSQEHGVPYCDANTTNSSVETSNGGGGGGGGSGSGISMRTKKMIELRKKLSQSHKEKQQKEVSAGIADHFEQQNRQNVCPANMNITTMSVSSSDANSSISSRVKKMMELRKKCVRGNIGMHSKEEADDSKGAISKGLTERNVTVSMKSIDSYSTNNMDQYSYQQLEQSLTCTTGNDSNLDTRSHESKSELSVVNSRAKHLSALRHKLKAPQAIPSHCETNANITLNSPDSSLAMTSSKYKENLKKIKDQYPRNVEHDDKIDIFSFKMRPKMLVPEMPAMTGPKLPIVESSKDQQDKTNVAFDGMTLVPAGFDIARLQTYRDEKNHWHRKKSTRYDHVPHDTSSCEEMLLNQSSSSSDFFQIKPPGSKQKHSESALAKRLQRPSGFQDQSDGVPPSQISASTTTNSTIVNKSQSSSQIRKRCRDLKSPTSQIDKIDEILKQNSFENELGNKGLKRLSGSPPRHTKDVRKEGAGGSTTTCITDSDTTNTTADSHTGILIENRNLGVMTKSPENYFNKKHLKNISNYTTLMEVKHTEHLPIVKGEIKLQTKFIDHLVLAHSSVPLLPIENVAEASFLPEIHEEMRNMRINKVYRIQVYSWAHSLRGNSLFVVNPSRTGRTWSYLPALCSLVCFRNGALKPSYGPVALVLVASSRHVESVYSYSRRLMSGFKAAAPTCVPSYGMRNFVDTKVQLLSGCGILITTPSSLLRVLKDNENEPLFDWERLHHIVIDDMDVMLSRSHEDFEAAVRIVFKMAKKTKYKTLLPQLTVTSRDWDGLMIRLILKSNQPLLLIGDFLEAAVYGRATLSVKLKSSGEKNDTIHRFLQKQTQSLQGNLAHKRLMIMCNGDEDVEKVHKFLTECGYPCLVYYSRATDNEITTVDEWKNKISSQILICTDARLHELQIQNVHSLIHYSMPTSWTQFTTRFSALAQTYDNFVSKKFQDPIASAVAPRTASENSPHSMILLDEENSLQLPRLVDFMRKHNQNVHPDILAVSKRVLVMREESRICNGSLLCPQLMEFGECDEARCDNRHELTRYDVIGEHDGIPCEGEMQIHILKVFSPTHYTARLLQHKASNTNNWLEVRRSREALAFTMQLDVHYRNEHNLSLHWPPKINDMCMYKYADNFRRALVLDAPPALIGKNINVVQSKLRVKLKLIDDGTIINDIKCSEIYICDDKFKDFPAQAVDIRLMHVVPYDNERTWDSKTTKQVQKWIMDDLKKGHIVKVNINFSLANTVWVKNVVVMEELATLGTYRQFVNLKMSLIQKNFAMVYNGERKHVRDIAEEYGLLQTSSQGHQDVSGSSIDDYQSCQNESIDLIKFSSSNCEETSVNSSMQSSKKYPQSDHVKILDVKELKTVEDKEQSTTQNNNVSAITLSSNIGEAEENWDNIANDDKVERNEVFVPLKKVLPPTAEKPPLFSSPSPSSTQVESWSQLLLNDVTKVEIGDEGENGNWENIFLQIIDKKHMQMFDDLVELINKHVEHIKANIEKQKRVYDFQPLHNCIVKYNKIYLRAKVHAVFGVNVKERLYRFYLCDYGCFTNVKSSELYNDCFYETTDEIIQFIPYQSVHCTLVGIQWDLFAKRYQVTKEYIYACAVEERSEEEKKKLCLYNLPIHSYKILLFECEKEGEFSNAEMFNKTLLDVGITTSDEATKHYLDYKLDPGQQNVEREELVAIEEVSRRESSSEDEICTFEQLIACMQRADEISDNDNTLFQETTNVLKNIKIPEIEKNDTVKEQTPVDKQEMQQKQLSAPVKTKKTTIKSPYNMANEIDGDEEDHCTTDSDNINKNSSSSSIASSNGNLNATESLLLPLSSLNKRPLTTWYETDSVIFLSIHAPDIKDYMLQVKQRSVLFVTQIQSDNYVLHLNLLGAIDPECVSHEIKGLNVVVRLVKAIFLKWPRLLQETTKYSWLKYNYSCFDSSELECIMPQQRLQAILEKSPNLIESNQHNEYDSEDSEQDKFETFNRIENNEECYDPFS